ncbi:hypothetical protein [Nannocystis radixulma]|uniref:Leucine Rich repeat-containing protein n=1 Tax=Nannocystis radixulma TaxID=2995305 RepID=A0ABT5BSP3_9BACT|nr:hypothetical protein [Nannocystis radixulma]MDC0675997.1 hypothetical protein [Nannocystis radixulma]
MRTGRVVPGGSLFAALFIAELRALNLLYALTSWDDPDAQFLELLRRAPALRHLDLAHNDLGEPALIALATCSQARQLRRLVLTGNAAAPAPRRAFAAAGHADIVEDPRRRRRRGRRRRRRVNRRSPRRHPADERAVRTRLLDLPSRPGPTREHVATGRRARPRQLGRSSVASGQRRHTHDARTQPRISDPDGLRPRPAPCSPW